MNIKEVLAEELWLEEYVGVSTTSIPLGYAFIKQNEHLSAPLQKHIMFAIKDGHGWEITRLVEKKEIFAALSLSRAFELVTEWKEVTDELLSYLKNFTCTGLSNSELLDAYNHIFDLLVRSWSYPILAEGCDHFGTYDLVPLVQRTLDIDFDTARDIAITLTQATTKSFLDEEKLSLLKCALLEDPSDALELHSNTFFWIGTNYLRERYLDAEYFRGELKELMKAHSLDEVKEKIRLLENYEEDIRIKKAQIRERYSFDSDLNDKLLLLELMSWWVDERKVTMLKTFHALFAIVDEMSTRFTIDVEVLKYAFPNEIRQILASGKIPSSLETRKRGFIWLMNDSYECSVIEGDAALDLIAKHLETSAKKEVSGLVASMGDGSITGEVSIVHDVSADPFKEGCILVTSMTRPEFVPLMRKAKAIVTDEGGITCHAAIVSRELGIPCIIGTKNATKVLRNGMMIEVDVNKGVVTPVTN